MALVRRLLRRPVCRWRSFTFRWTEMGWATDLWATADTVDADGSSTSGLYVWLEGKLV